MTRKKTLLVIVCTGCGRMKIFTFALQGNCYVILFYEFGDFLSMATDFYE